jgi:hypothetical protein
MSNERSALATAVRNMATSQCIFMPYDGLDLAYRDGALCKVVQLSSLHEPQCALLPLRVEELPGMSDDEIWQRVIG